MTVVPDRVERGCVLHATLTVRELLGFMKNIQERAFIEVGRTQVLTYLAAGDVPGATVVAGHIYKMSLDQLAKEGLGYEELSKRWIADKSIHERIAADLIAAGYDSKEILAETDRRYKYSKAQAEARKLSHLNELEVGINVRDVGIC